MIKVFHFGGQRFDDAATADIVITGYATKSVYDLAYNDLTRVLYASGDGFVTAFDILPIALTTGTGYLHAKGMLF